MYGTLTRHPPLRTGLPIQPCDPLPSSRSAALLSELQQVLPLVAHPLLRFPYPLFSLLLSHHTMTLLHSSYSHDSYLLLSNLPYLNSLLLSY